MIKYHELRVTSVKNYYHYIINIYLFVFTIHTYIHIYKYANIHAQIYSAYTSDTS